ncbi:MAG: SIMPL domain-containing protein [Lautropia sp.]|nr:SIMPL domain-containing protein [Lautropia sp.]
MNTSSHHPAPHPSHPVRQASRPPLPLSVRLLVAGLLAGSVFSAQAGSKNQTEVELSASVSRHVPNDEMRVQLATEHTGKAIEQLNAAVLKAVQDALAQAKRYRAVKARAGSISTSSEWNRHGERNGWQVRGTIILEGTDTAAVARLAGELAKRLHLEHVGYRLSEPRRQEEENRLLPAVANAFKTRARATAEAFGRPDYVIKRIDLSTHRHSDGDDTLYPMMKATAAESSAANVPTEGGETIITLTARGVVELR